MMPKLRISLQTPSDDVTARVRDAADWSNKNANQAPGPTTLPASSCLCRRRHRRSLCRFEARIVPENITLLPKTTTQATGGNAFNERVIAVRKATPLPISCATKAHRRTISAPSPKFSATRPRRRRQRRPEVAHSLAAVPGSRSGCSRFALIVAMTHRSTPCGAVRHGKYVSVDVKNATPRSPTTAKTTTPTTPPACGSIKASTRPRAQSSAAADHRRVDPHLFVRRRFQRKVQPATPSKCCTLAKKKRGADSRNDVLFAALTVGGESKKFYRFQSPDDGLVDYYDDAGKSAKKFLVRKPVPKASCVRHSASGDTRSSATPRSHRVDWAAPTGTPIYAAGNGVVEKADWESVTASSPAAPQQRLRVGYGHMSAYARGIDEGKRVRQGQVIGFVGSTGLSTGCMCTTKSASTAASSIRCASAAARPRAARPDVGRLRTRARTPRRHHGAQAARVAVR